MTLREEFERDYDITDRHIQDRAMPQALEAQYVIWLEDRIMALRKEDCESMSH